MVMVVGVFLDRSVWLVADYWLLVIDHWGLIIRDWSLGTGDWLRELIRKKKKKERKERKGREGKGRKGNERKKEREKKGRKKERKEGKNKRKEMLILMSGMVWKNMFLRRSRVLWMNCHETIACIGMYSLLSLQGNMGAWSSLGQISTSGWALSIPTYNKS